MESVTNNATTYTNLLSSLKPAATKLVLDSSTKLPELLKLTLLNLVLNEVLILKKNTYSSHPNDPYISTCLIIETSKNFENYKPDAFEKCFTDILNTDIYFKLRPYIRKILLGIQSEYQYKKLILDGLNLQPLFSTTIFRSLLRSIELSNEGRLYRKYFREYFTYVNTNINNWIESDIQKAYDAIAFLKGNIFLLDTINSEVLTTLMNAVQSVPESAYTATRNDFILESFLELTFDLTESFDVYSETFEYAADSFDFSDGFGDCIDID